MIKTIFEDPLLDNAIAHVQDNSQNFVQDPSEYHAQHQINVQYIDKDKFKPKILFRSRSLPDDIFTDPKKRVIKTKSTPKDLNKQFKNGKLFT